MFLLSVPLTKPIKKVKKGFDKNLMNLGTPAEISELINKVKKG
jgi:hypothetical protein